MYHPVCLRVFLADFWPLLSFWREREEFGAMEHAATLPSLPSDHRSVSTGHDTRHEQSVAPLKNTQNIKRTILGNFKIATLCLARGVATASPLAVGTVRLVRVTVN